MRRDQPIPSPSFAGVDIDLYQRGRDLRPPSLHPNDGYTHTGVTNREFFAVRGGSVEEYSPV